MDEGSGKIRRDLSCVFHVEELAVETRMSSRVGAAGGSAELCRA